MNIFELLVALVHFTGIHRVFQGPAPASDDTFTVPFLQDHESRFALCNDKQILLGPGTCMYTPVSCEFVASATWPRVKIKLAPHAPINGCETMTLVVYFVGSPQKQTLRYYIAPLPGDTWEINPVGIDLPGETLPDIATLGPLGIPPAWQQVNAELYRELVREMDKSLTVLSVSASRLALALRNIAWVLHRGVDELALLLDPSHHAKIGQVVSTVGPTLSIDDEQVTGPLFLRNRIVVAIVSADARAGSSDAAIIANLIEWFYCHLNENATLWLVFFTERKPPAADTVRKCMEGSLGNYVVVPELRSMPQMPLFKSPGELKLWLDSLPVCNLPKSEYLHISRVPDGTRSIIHHVLVALDVLIQEWRRVDHPTDDQVKKVKVAMAKHMQALNAACAEWDSSAQDPGDIAQVLSKMCIEAHKLTSAHEFKVARVLTDPRLNCPAADEILSLILGPRHTHVGTDFVGTKKCAVCLYKLFMVTCGDCKHVHTDECEQANPTIWCPVIVCSGGHMLHAQCAHMLVSHPGASSKLCPECREGMKFSTVVYPLSTFECATTRPGHVGVEVNAYLGSHLETCLGLIQPNGHFSTQKCIADGIKKLVGNRAGAVGQEDPIHVFLCGPDLQDPQRLGQLLGPKEYQVAQCDSDDPRASHVDAKRVVYVVYSDYYSPRMDTILPRCIGIIRVDFEHKFVLNIEPVTRATKRAREEQAAAEAQDDAAASSSV